MKSSQLQPFTRTTLTTTVGGTAKVLIDGYITGRQLSPAGAPGGFSYVEVPRLY